MRFEPMKMSSSNFVPAPSTVSLASGPGLSGVGIGEWAAGAFVMTSTMNEVTVTPPAMPIYWSNNNIPLTPGLSYSGHYTCED
jgi:hypothetical protein